MRKENKNNDVLNKVIISVFFVIILVFFVVIFVIFKKKINKQTILHSSEQF